jgi:hypothetical protein
MKKEMAITISRNIKETMLVRELHMRESYDEDIDDFNTAFSFVVDFEGMRYAVGELFCDSMYSIEEVEHYILCYLMARSGHDDSKLYWQMVNNRQLNEETETIIPI